MIGWIAVLGFVLVASSVLIAMADVGGMSRRMPTQIPPRRVAMYPLVAGVALLVVAVVGAATS